MKLFDVYPLFDIEPVKAQGCYIWDKNDHKYLDLYGGHAVISIGHTHPHYVERITQQLNQIGFYSNSVQNQLQKDLARKLGEISGLDDYNLFLCNSGAEANENALKLASFATGKKKVISFKKGFHGRTSAAVAVTDNPKIIAPINSKHESVILELNNLDTVEEALKNNDICAVIIEGIQGIGGIIVPDAEFLEGLEQLCNQYNTVLILDEIQSGYGRSGKFFAFQYSKVKPHLVTMAKGMGNGFPIGGVLISNKFEPWYGMLGTTFGGNYLACAAALAVLEVIEKEDLIQNAQKVGSHLLAKAKKMLKGCKVRGYGLMIGLEFDEEIVALRKKLLFEEKIFTGVSGTKTIRILPPLNLSIEEADLFIDKLVKCVQ
ncbi:aspartate aminotransferase family protein [Saccharicrinis fermentans]|uniref:Acetylornithine aminotransferase n=1 Tax=Saccharicrinis fermentans DSM 9555 = JCM 21142 TaxID=869213 RepID=W7YK34_9BACT|nr:aminotransferase class III-fold pyridoxal phosphate-dependent enzyme [Saccharicrinis fermentans]GAF04896.1 acetylornithine aminotransferase [Saccharicrinis fermentans DSM 9555 = JCM 21142]